MRRISHATVHAIQIEYGDLVYFEFRHAPFSDHASDAARLAEAARRQGRLDVFLDAVVLAPPETDLHALAESLLEPRRLARDLADPAIALEVDRALALARALGLRGTPTFFVNGVLIEGAEPVSTFTPLIDALIATARARHRVGPDWLDEQRRVHNRALDTVLRGSAKNPQAPSADPTSDVHEIFPSPAPMLREGRGPRILTLFGDPTSPRTQQLIAAIDPNLPPDLTLELRFALDDRREAPAFAAIAICADAQRRFPAFIDGLANAPSEARSPTRLIAEAHLDAQHLLECLRSPLPNLLLEQHRNEAARLTSFPAVFLDGVQIPLEAASFRDDLRMALERIHLEGPPEAPHRPDR